MLALRNVLRQKRRSAVAISAVGFGVVALILAAGFIEWIYQAMREDTIHSHLGHAQIVRPGYLDSGMADPFAYLLPAAPDELKTIESLPHVRTVAPRLAFSGLISHGEATVSFIGEGVDPERELIISEEVTVSSGKNLTQPDEKAALLGEGLAKNLGVVPGDDIVLLVTTANGAANAIEVKVAGVFFTASKEFDDNALRLPIHLARKLMRVKGATSWVILLDRTDRTQATVGELRAILPAQDFEVIPWTDLADFYNKTVLLYGKQINLMKYVIGMLIVLTISNTQMMSVLERTSEIGTIMAMGQRSSRVQKAFLIEGFLLGVVGGVAGVSTGYLLATVLSIVGIPMPPAPGMTTGFTAEIIVTSEMVLDALLLALVTTLLASMLPAAKASRMNIVDALRRNQ